MEPFIPYGRQDITEADIVAVTETLRGEFLTQGPTIELFEKSISDYVGARHTVAVNSATSALHIACLALGLGQGDLLWTSPTTFAASANCGRYCGADVDFVDIDPDSGLMSVQRLSEKLVKAKSEGRLPKILIPVHLTGASCAMEPIKKLCDQYAVRIIEDASHAIGGSYQNERVGGCRYSDITVFSLHPVKIITAGEGGLATTNDEDLAYAMRSLRSHGITKNPTTFKNKSAGPWYYEQQQLGFNYRLTDIQAALGLSQLKRLDLIVSERQRLLESYQDLAIDLPLQLLVKPKDVCSSVHLCVVRLSDTSRQHHRQVFEGLRASGLGVQVHYTPVHLHPYYTNLGFKSGDYPEAEAYATNAISLPLYPGLLDSQQRRVIETLGRLLTE